MYYTTFSQSDISNLSDIFGFPELYVLGVLAGTRQTDRHG